MITNADRKAKQGFLRVVNSCRNCGNRTPMMAHWEGPKKVPGPDNTGYAFIDNYRCGIGGFMVGPMSACDRWESAK